MVALLERVKRVVLGTTPSAGQHVPPQALRDYDVTDEGCETMRRRFNDSFSDEEWDDIEDTGKRVACR